MNLRQKILSQHEMIVLKKRDFCGFFKKITNKNLTISSFNGLLIFFNAQFHSYRPRDINMF